MSTAKPLRVAVVGGGIGGLCVALGLLKHAHLKVTVYEAASAFSEIGAGVAFGPNAQRALKLIGPELEQAFLSQATHNLSEEYAHTFAEYVYGQGDKAGQKIAAPRNETGMSSVHRAKFLEEFVKLVPEGVARFGKRLVGIEDLGEEGVRLKFKDGTTEEADCLIGADGVHSVTRGYLLGEDTKASCAQFSHSVAYRALVPMQEAIDAIGERYASNSHIFVGPGAFLMIYPIDFGKTMNAVAIDSTFDDWEGPWVQKSQVSDLVTTFADWSPTVQKLVKLFDRPGMAAWSMWDHLPASTFFRGKVAMMGDAAHASTPFQGQGAAQAIEDSLCLQALLGEVDSADKIPLAFKAYDTIRRPRSQKVTQTSREAGQLLSMQHKDVEDNADLLKENLEWRYDWMWHRDIAGERDQTLLIYQKLVDGKLVID